MPTSSESGASPPTHYTCFDCGASGVKLWRDYNTFLDHQTLRCARCAEVKQDKSYTEPRDPVSGKRGYSDQIGWLVPAVPVAHDQISPPTFALVEGDTFWGYTSVPPDGVAWWRGLPLQLGSA